jgi:GGDEF domain-containing protein
MRLFPADDVFMMIRLKRQLLALASYLMFLFPLIYSVENGWMDFSYLGLVVFTFVAVLVNVVFFWIIRSGRSKHLKDPSLTFLQLVVAQVLSIAMVRYANEARPVLLMLFFTSFFFGVFGLSRRQFWTLAASTIAGYAVVVLGSEFFANPRNVTRFKLETLQFIALSMLLCWIALVGGYVASLRQRVSAQKDELAAIAARLRLLVSYDELTGVFNRRRLLEVAEHEKACADRHSYKFSVCLLDIDYFKKINDEHGHQVGDEALREFSASMRSNARKMDWLGRNDEQQPPSLNLNTRLVGVTGEAGEGDVSFGRYGGEEFLIVMPHTAEQAACMGVERLRKAMQEKPMETSAGPVQVRFSAGVAEHVAGESVDATIARADAALYLAKNTGRNHTRRASVGNG